MPKPNWSDRLQNVINRFKSKSEVRQYHDRVSAVLEVAATSGADTEMIELLRRGCNLVERWVKRPPENGAEAVAEFVDFWRTARSRIPTVLSFTILARFPKYPKAHGIWTNFILQEADAAIIHLMLRHNLLRATELKLLAKREPDRLYASAVPEALASTGTQFPPELIARLYAEKARETEGPWQELVVAAFQTDARRNAEADFLKLHARTTAAADILNLLVGQPAAALRLSRYASRILSSGGGGKNHAVAAAAIRGLIGACEARLSHGAPMLVEAGMVLAGLRLELMLSKDPLAVELSASAADVCVATARRLVDSKEIPAVMAVVVLLARPELGCILQEQVERLSSGVIDDSSEADLPGPVARFIGRKEVVEQVLYALEVSVPGDAAKAVGNALFNFGVRRFGEPGERVQFDPTRHDAAGSDILEGESAQITSAGYLMSTGTGDAVLRRARVHAVD